MYSTNSQRSLATPVGQYHHQPFYPIQEPYYYNQSVSSSQRFNEPIYAVPNKSHNVFGLPIPRMCVSRSDQNYHLKQHEPHLFQSIPNFSSSSNDLRSYNYRLQRKKDFFCPMYVEENPYDELIFPIHGFEIYPPVPPPRFKRSNTNLNREVPSRVERTRLHNQTTRETTSQARSEGHQEVIDMRMTLKQEMERRALRASRERETRSQDRIISGSLGRRKGSRDEVYPRVSQVTAKVGHKPPYQLEVLDI